MASAHQVGIPIPDPAAATRARAEDSRPFFRQEEIDEGGVVTTYWTLQTQRMLSADLVVVGGQKVDRMLEELRVGLSTKDVHLVFEIDGKSLFGESGPPGGSEGFEKRVIPIQSVSEQGASGQILLFVSRSSVVEAQQSLLERGFALAGLALILALVLGFWLSGRLSKPLEDLAEAAGKVASGRRDLSVKERRGRDELSELIRSFNIMTETLEDSETRLK